MTLAALKAIAVKQRARIHFRTAGGAECVVDEHGIATLPASDGAAKAALQLEDVVSATREFELEAAVPVNVKQPPVRKLTVEQLAALAGPGAAAGDHED